MALLSPTSKVLIIGSGISGVSLAQILRKQSIPFEIYERDDGTRSQGWTIALDHCLDHLIPLLPDDLEDIHNASANKAAGVADYMGFYDGRTHELLGVVGNAEKGSPGYNVCASRGRFRDILSQHLDIRFKKRLTKYETDAAGVTAHFDDGSTARGDVLVAADGARSAVRAQLLPAFKATPSTFVAIHGNVKLAKDEYSRIIGNGHTTGVVMGDVGLKFYMVLLEFNPDGTAVFNWNCSFQSNDSYVDYEWTQTATQQSLHDKVVKLIQHFPSFVVEPIKAAGPFCVHQPPVGLFETILPSQGLPPGPVTLIGDSSHSMVPFRGMGANAAVIDACDLGKSLMAGIKNSATISSTLKGYEHVAIPRGRRKVLESRETAESGAGEELAGGRL